MAIAFLVGAGLIVFGVVISVFAPELNPSRAFEYGPLFLAGSGLIAWQRQQQQ